MPRVTRLHKLTIALFGLVQACTNAPETAVTNVEECAAQEWGSMPRLADSVVTVDLDCDGQPEHLVVTWGEVESVVEPVLRIQSTTLGGEVRVPVEGLPSIVAVGDLDGDSIGDLVLSVSDESTVFTTVVLATVSGPMNAIRDSEVDWTRLQFQLDEQASEKCREGALPHVARNEHGPWILVIPFGASWDGGCEAPSMARLSIVKGVLTTVK